MSRQHAIQLEGTVVERLSQSVVRVELSNGHRLIAFARRKDRSWAAGLTCGNQVAVEVSPGDFSSGRLEPNIDANKKV